MKNQNRFLRAGMSPPRKKRNKESKRRNHQSYLVKEIKNKAKWVLRKRKR